MLKHLATGKNEYADDVKEEGGENAKAEAVEIIDEVIEEFNEAYAEVIKSFEPHLGTEEIIMTFGNSKLVEECLEEGGKEK